MLERNYPNKEFYRVFAGIDPDEQAERLKIIKSIIKDDDDVSNYGVDHEWIPTIVVNCTWEDFCKIKLKLDLSYERIWI